MPRTVSILFCGGCNPRIDRGAVAAEVKAALEERGFTVCYNNRSTDYLIYINGCTAACAVKGHPDKPCTVVAAATVDSRETHPSCLGKEVLEKVMMVHG